MNVLICIPTTQSLPESIWVGEEGLVVQAGKGPTVPTLYNFPQITDFMAMGNKAFLHFPMPSEDNGSSC